MARQRFALRGIVPASSSAVSVLVATFVLTVITSLAAQPVRAAGLNDTGQTKCYDGAGTVISCDTSVDDGRYGRDAAATAGVLTKTGAGAAGFDFTKIANNGTAVAAGTAFGAGATDWACTHDNNTGLDWEVKVPGSGFRGADEKFSWYNSNAATNGGNNGTANGGTCSGAGPNGAGQCDTEKYVANVNAAGLCGASDWRLPTAYELMSIVDYGKSGFRLDADYFPANGAEYDTAWSSNVTVVTKTNGETTIIESFPKLVSGGHVVGFAQSYLESGVRLVRGGTVPTTGTCTAGNPNTSTFEATPTSDFTDNGNGTVTHTKTGLMWKRCAEGQTWDGSTCTGNGTGMNWSDALTTAEGATFAGHSDWRLPNVKELYSIVETCGGGPAINQTVFPNPARGYLDYGANPGVTPGSTFIYDAPIYHSASTSDSAPSIGWPITIDVGTTLLIKSFIIGLPPTPPIALPYSPPKTDPGYVRLVRNGQPADFFDIEPYIPAPFSFTDQTGVALNSTITSASVQITGLGETASWTASGGTACASNSTDCSSCGTYATSGSIQNNQYLCARHTSSASFSTAVDTTVTISGVSDTFTSTTLAADTTPDTFTFVDQSDVPLSSTRTSAPVQINGINTTTSWAVTGSGQACVSSANNCTCDVAAYAASGTITNGQYMCARHTASNSYSTAVDTTVTVGDKSDTFTSTTIHDTFPDSFTFVDQVNVPLSSTITSAPVQITGIDAATNWSITGGVGQACVSSANDCSCNVASYGTSGTITNGQYLCARHTSSGSYSTAVNTEVTVGDKSDAFTSTTLDDTFPDGFVFIDQVNVPLSTVITSAPVQITGINAATDWNISAGVGTACVGTNTANCGCANGSFAASGTVTNGQYLCARHNSSGNYSTAVNTTVTVGDQSDTFTSTTVAPPPDSKLPLPTGPNSFPGSCGVLGPTVVNPNPAYTKPLGELLTGGNFYLTLELGDLAGPVDVYIVVELPNGQKLMLNSQKQWVPYPPATPFLKNIQNPVSMTDVSNSLFSKALADIPPGAYKAYLVMVPAGTNPATFDMTKSPYYLWCFGKTF